MEKDSFILFAEQKEVFDSLTDEQAGKLIKAIFQYEVNNIEPGNENQLIKLAFIPINKEKYLNKDQKNRENGLKGGRPRKANGNEEKPKKPNGFLSNPKKHDNEYEYDNEYDNDISKEIYKEKSSSEDKSSSDVIAKASKHKYGDYRHVLLKDEELQKLKEEYPNNWEDLIKYLDEYIEMKGYKAKNHYLCIKKWVVNAVNGKSKQLKQTQMSSREYSNEEYEGFYDNL